MEACLLSWQVIERYSRIREEEYRTVSAPWFGSVLIAEQSLNVALLDHAAMRLR